MTSTGARALALALAGLLCGAVTLAAQEPPETPITAPPVAADTLDRTLGPSPRGAALRSLALPGWGQLYVGAPRRAAVFIALQTTSYAMLAKTIHGLNEIRAVERTAAAPVRDSILAAAQTDTALARQIQNPFVLDDMIGADPDVAAARLLASSRRRHRQDWVAYTLVFTLASGIDAYVAAHLADFPATITAEPRAGGGVSLHVNLPVGRTR